MNVSEKLMNEHQLILKYIGLLKTVTQMQDVGQRDTFVLDNGRDLIDFIQSYADRYHHAKEEEILFRHMDKPGVFTLCNPVPQMITEHTEGRGYVAAMIESLEKKEVNTFCENASHYGNLLIDHIRKEDEILYPMAETGLSDEAKREVITEYDEAEKKYNKTISLDSYYQERLTLLEKSLNI